MSKEANGIEGGRRSQPPGPVLRLPPGIRACLFDLDGVLTQTAAVHAAAWKDTFDRFLAQRHLRPGEPFAPFDIVIDYDTYVDGRPRAEGTSAFLASRGIKLSMGDRNDPPEADTVWGLSNRKNQRFLELVKSQEMRAYPGSVRFVRAVRQAGMPTAVVSSSANAGTILTAAGIADLFDQRVDGVVAAERHLAGKPAPDTFLAAAEMIGVAPAHAAVFEDALAGVEAARAGHFGLVVAIDRTGQAAVLKAHGAHLVVADLDELIR